MFVLPCKEYNTCPFLEIVITEHDLTYLYKKSIYKRNISIFILKYILEI